MLDQVKKLTVGIPTKDRLVEISLLMNSLCQQTFTDFDIMIINDCKSDCLSNATFGAICNVLRERGHSVTILQGETRGPHIAGQKIFENVETEYVCRLDDDVVLEPIFLEELMNVITSDPKIGAVGPCYITPSKSFAEQKIDPSYPRDYIEHLGKVFWDEGGNLFLTGYLQNCFHPKGTAPIPVEHLNSGFLYRREAVEKIGGYFLELSIAGHREESDLSYRIFMQGYTEFLVTSAIAFHYHPMSGGIRETLGQWHDKTNWDHDEKLFLNRMEQWLPKPSKITEDQFTSVLILSYGDHSKLDTLLNGISAYTNHSAEYIIANNDPSETSRNRFAEMATKYMRSDFKFKQFTSELPVSEARNQLVNMSDNRSKYICFLDDDVVILGRYNQTTDWLDYLYNRFQTVNTKYPCGAVSPMLTWFEDLQTYCVSIACLFTSKKVWGVVGGLDPVFGNKTLGTWGYEDTDWSYRCVSAGFKLSGVVGGDLPIYHHDTTPEIKSPWKEAGLLKAKELLFDKHDVNKINEICRKGYPFTPNQLSVRGTKINLGCNYMKLDDFINIDINPEVNPDMVLDMTKLRERFAPNSIDLVLFSQTLEHVTEELGIEALKQIFECLVVGGCVIVEVPDGGDIEEKFQSGKINEHQYNVLKGGSHEVAYQDHHALYTREKLEGILKSIGFRFIEHLPLEMTSDKWEAIRIDAIK